MILVDTSIWVDHFRHGRSDLAAVLSDGEAACHSFVIGELACGNLRNRKEILSLLAALPSVPSSDHEEFLAFVDHNHLAGVGLGFVAIHLLASARLSGVPLWTSDRTLKQVATQLHIAHTV